MSGPVVIAIDGPGGSGKSTTANALARRLGLAVLDTGAMYRALTLGVLDAGLDPADAATVASMARTAEISVEHGVVRLDGRDVTDAIREPVVTDAVSVVAAHPGVRTALVERQRTWVAEHGGAVVEGRDIGTVVFPDATVKVYLVADEAVRAERRHRQDELGGRGASVTQVQESLLRRDSLDSTRSASPLQAAPDALVIDSSARDVDDIVAEILEHYRSAS